MTELLLTHAVLTVTAGLLIHRGGYLFGYHQTERTRGRVMAGAGCIVMLTDVILIAWWTWR